MAASVSGSKTVTHGVAPHLSAAVLTTLLATPVENLTIAQLRELLDAVSRIAHGDEQALKIGQLLV